MSKKENKYDIDILCPACEEENTIHLSSDIKCNKCNKTLIGFKYKQFILPVIATVILSGVGGAISDDLLNLNRASVKTEYKMMKTCINRFGGRDNCICAVESMSGFVDAAKARFYGTKWLKDVLKEKYEDCVD